MLSRRFFLTSLVAAPAVIVYDRLMPVKEFDPLSDWSELFGSGDFTLEMWLRPKKNIVSDVRITKGVARYSEGLARSYLNGSPKVFQFPYLSDDWQHVHIINDRREAAKILRASPLGDALRNSIAPDKTELTISSVVKK